MLTGENAEQLGIRVMYNMPIPTTLHFWRGAKNVLQKYSAGWNGRSSEKLQKTINVRRVKAEMGYRASDYFTMVYEQLAGRVDVNMDDLSGTQLEEAETRLFREALAESLRATMWIGDTSRTAGPFNTFDGLLPLIKNGLADEDIHIITSTEYNTVDAGEGILKKVWDRASVQLKELKNEGQLAFFVTSDIYSKYEESLDSATLEAAYIAKQQGREALSYRGIPVIDMQVSGYMAEYNDATPTWALLTDRRNLVVAVNTADFPGSEVRMWYNPDEMENRQRATFAIGCNYLAPEFLSVAIKNR
jgi:hypothetical protein